MIDKESQVVADFGDEFQSCGFKIDNADHHLEIIDKEIDAWQDTKPYSLTRKRDENGSRHALVVNILTPPLMDRWSVIAGDCIHNLRSALDHLVYRLAIRTKLTPEDIKRLQFPISDWPTEFIRQRDKLHRLKGVCPAIQTLIENLQPYKRGHEFLPPLLRLLRDLDDIDKHRLLHVVMAQPFQWQIEEAWTPNESQFTVIFDTYPIEDGAELAIMTLDPPSTEFKYKFKGTFAISIGYPAPVIGEQRQPFVPLVALLSMLREEVCFVINAIVRLA